MIKLLAAIYLVWGFNWVVMKEANLFFPPVTFSCYRFIIGALVLLAVCFLVETADTAASLLAVDRHYGIFADCRQYGSHPNRHGNPSGRAWSRSSITACPCGWP